MRASSWTFRKIAIAASGAVALSLTCLPSAASAAGSSTVVPITTFTVTPSTCDGPTNVPIVDTLLDDAGLGQTIPGSSLSGSYCAAPPSALSLIDSASATAVGSPNGSATVTAQALGNALIAAQANSDVELSASIPLTSPASSIEVTIPYTTTGVTWTTPNDEGCGINAPDTCASGALVIVQGLEGTVLCADGSRASVTPFSETGSILVTPLATPTPAGSGTVSGIEFYCPDGSDLLPSSTGLGFIVTVADSVYSDSSQNTTASADIALQDVTATINS